MIKIINFIYLFSMFLFSYQSTIPGVEYMNQVSNSYEEYYIVSDQELSFGDYTLVFGRVDDKYYLSCFLYNEGVLINQQVRITVNEKLTTYVADSGVVAGYGLLVKTNDQIKISIGTDNNIVDIEEYTFEELLNEFNLKKLSGNGTGEFPKNKKEENLINKMKRIIIIFAVISCLFIAFLFILYKKRLGRFSDKYQSEQVTYYEENYDEIDEEEEKVDDDYNNAGFETPPVDKQAIMDRLFEEYRHGDITEEELNEKLKKLWWSEND